MLSSMNVKFSVHFFFHRNSIEKVAIIFWTYKISDYIEVVAMRGSSYINFEVVLRKYTDNFTISLL